MPESHSNGQDAPDSWLDTKANTEPVSGCEPPDHLDDIEAKVWNAAVNILFGNGKCGACPNSGLSMRKCGRCSE